MRSKKAADWEQLLSPPGTDEGVVVELGRARKKSTLHDVLQ